jgi:DNA-directed RNA polymerase specialized sigma24 family protein
VLAFARSLCRSVVEGDDLFQEAMLRAFRKLCSLRDDDAFRPWLYRIVITPCIGRATGARCRHDTCPVVACEWMVMKCRQSLTLKEGR